MHILTLDAETYYDDQYSLRKMPMASYIRDPRFHCWGAAAKIDDGPAKWVPGDKLPALFAGLEATGEPIVLLGQNTMFDAAIYAWHYGWSPTLYVDIMGMSRAVLGPLLASHSLDAQCKYWGLPGKWRAGALAAMKGNRNPTQYDLDRQAEYACDDSNQTKAIYNNLRPYFPRSEFPVLDWTIRMFVHPQLTLNPDTLNDLYYTELDRRSQLLEDVGLTIDTIRSNDKFAEVLLLMGVEPPTKVSMKTGKVAYAFSKQDQEFVELLNDGDEEVAMLVEARLGLKTSIVETRTLKYWQVSQTGTMWPVDLQYSGAQQTHRLSGGGGGGGNVQNLGRPTKANPVTLRHAIEAPPGFVCVVGDSSQIELRISAKVCGQQDILDMLVNKDDLYSSFATDIYGTPIDKHQHPDERQTGKIGVLSLGYQAGGGTFKRAYAVETRKAGNPKTITMEEAQRIVDIYRMRFYRFPLTWRALGDNLQVMARGQIPTNLETNPPLVWGTDRITGPSGLALKYPDIGWRTILDKQTNSDKQAITFTSHSKTNKSGIKPIYGGALLENISQFLAREIMTYHGGIFMANGLHPAMQTHDEYCFVVPEAEAEETKAYVTEVMSMSPPWWPDLPLACEVGSHQVYGKAK